MTVITERRRKCDYCGVVSPAYRSEKPKGWIITVGYAWNVLQLQVRINDFCCQAHADKWEEEHKPKP